jgi:diguanylate cyclase (GGDEF)-like protein
VNDTYGHAAGDAVLANVGTILRRSARRSDFVARWGGEEFAVALPDTGAEGASSAGERLRACIEAASTALAGGAEVGITASIGVSTLMPGESLEALVARADRAMYAAKAAGRNRVEHASDVTA